ncbi:MAG: ubiquinol-cytochrome c reductase iron-sulfur subunit [Coleofasciculaceae cyanobacterium SM2_1_6]|nr:ubiquinol-cytochrome c reductase iron-sulfur subunit [Coleofasciculaceae cyanobacterium SM2_1_6]
MDRRTFLSWVGLGSLATSLPVALVACNSETPSASSPGSNSAGAPRDDGFVQVGTVAALETGAIVLETSSIGAVAVVRNNGELAAVNPTCTHKGCTVAWQPSGEYVCPCHQAKFSATGAVVGEGPAKVPLKVLQAKIEGDAVLVKANA